MITATDPLATPTALALLRAIDDGDDGVIPVLADYLEEAGDARAAGLRLIGDRSPREEGTFFVWDLRGDVARPTAHELRSQTYFRLGGYLRPGEVGRYYPYRHLALLALARALSPVR